MSTSNENSHPGDSQSGSDAEQIAREAEEIEVIRQNLGTLIDELAGRRSRLLGRPLLWAGLGAVSLGVGVGAWQWRARTIRRRESWSHRARQLALAARRAMNAPEKVARTSPSVPKKIITAAAVAAVGVVTRRIFSRYFAAERR